MLRWKVEKSLLKRRAVRTLAARQKSSKRPWIDPQVCTEAHASSGRRRQNRWCPGHVFQRLLPSGSSASRCFTPSCSSDGSLAVIQPLWVQKTSEVPSMFQGVATAHTCAHSASTALHQSWKALPHISSFILILLVTYLRLPEPLALKEKGLVVLTRATSPIVVGRDRNFRNSGSITSQEVRARYLWVGISG